MTSRAKYTSVRIETEIEKNREESNWSKVIELAEQLKERSPDFEYLSDFLVGEGRLESYLEEWPPIEANLNRAKLGLLDAKKYLQLASNDMGKKAGVALDAHLLLGKLHYACGQYSEGLHNFKQAELHALPEKKLPLRSLKVVAESFAIKGLCLQKDAKAPTKFKKAEREEEMQKCYDVASDLGLLYMQELDKQQTSNYTNTGSHSPQPTSVHKTLSPVLEQALQEAPALSLHQSRPQLALSRYRCSLGAVEVPAVNGVRLKLLCQMAELLLQGSLQQDSGGQGNGVWLQPQHGGAPSGGPWKPRQYAGLNQFIPSNVYEETILALLVAESIAVRYAVLSQSPEFKDARLSAYHDAAAVYDLLTIATVRWGQTSLLQESLERAMKFSFEEPHLWRQHALTLLTLGRHSQALSVLNEVIRLEPHSSVNCLLAAKLCYEHLASTPGNTAIADGRKYAKMACDREMAHSSGLLGKCHLYVGLGYHLEARSCFMKEQRESFRSSALEHLELAVQLEPNDHLCEYYLSLELACTCRISEALSHIHRAFALQPENYSTLHLFALLLSANQKHDEALTIVKAALEEYPDCLNLMYIQAHLEIHEENGEKALCTARQMLELWKVQYESQTSSDVPECDRKSDTRSVFQLYTSEMSDKDSSSLQAHSVAASRVEQALSEVASSVSSFNPRPGPQRAYMLLMDLWMLLAEIYLKLEQTIDVLKCIQEAAHIFPLSHQILHMRGLLHMQKEEWQEAKACFQNATAINPQHVRSLQQLGLVYHYLGLHGLAETTLKEAAKIEPNNHLTWYNLGKVLESLGEFDSASNAMATAINVEVTTPILPFTSSPLCFE